jgi:hypothetical protein
VTTKSEKSYMDRVAKLPCAICASHGVQLHHVREGQGTSQRAQNWLVIPLCPDCHTGPKNGIHGDRAMWKIHKMDEMDALAKTIQAIWEGA